MVVTKFIAPAPDMKIVDPVQVGTPDKFLPVGGRMVEWSEYWNRRLLQGDVHEVAQPN